MQKQETRQKGQIVEALPSLLFKVRLEADGREVLAHLAGKLKINHIKVLAGDNVLVEMSPYDQNRGRVVFRLK